MISSWRKVTGLRATCVVILGVRVKIAGASTMNLLVMIFESIDIHAELWKWLGSIVLLNARMILIKRRMPVWKAKSWWIFSKSFEMTWLCGILLLLFHDTEHHSIREVRKNWSPHPFAMTLASRTKGFFFYRRLFFGEIGRYSSSSSSENCST